MLITNHAGRGIARTLLAVGALGFALLAQADPPMRAARLSFLDGAVSLSPAGDENWVDARLNRPVAIGDGLWTDRNARAEVQFGVANVRLDEFTSAQLLNFDDRTIQLRLTQGRLNVHARALRNGETIEIATPNAAFAIREAGDYRIDVDPNADATTISVRQGAGDVYGEGAAFALRANVAARFYGRDLRAREFYSLAPLDEFDSWAVERDRRAERALASRYVSPEVIGYADLDQYGSWRGAEGYGNVWFPRDVPREWAPYRYGHWSWIDPWGWTWVDDAQWGFAPFHYGRWAQFDNRWGWVPGPINARPVYAPALVAFVGGPNFRLSASSGPAYQDIGWFPLAPGEVYRPAYTVSRDYVRNVNVSNTVVSVTVINNIYSNPTGVTQATYRNAQLPNAVTAVPTTVFAQAQPVQRGMVTVAPDAVRRAQVTAVAAVAPTSMGISGAASATRIRPPEEFARREVIARAAPPAPAAPIAQRIEMLQRDPGRPLERPAAAATAPMGNAQVRVVGNPTPVVLPAQTRAGNSAPPPAAARTAGDIGRPSVPGTPAATPVTPATAPPALQRERGGIGAATAPGATPPNPAPAAAAPQAGPRDRAVGAPIAAPPISQSAPPQNAPPPMPRDRGIGAPGVVTPAAGLAPPQNVPPPVQRDRGFGTPPPAAAPAPPPAGPGVASPAATPPPSRVAPPQPPQREVRGPDNAPMNPAAAAPKAAAPAAAAPTAAPPPAARVVPVPEQRPNTPVPPAVPMQRQRETPPPPAPQPQQPQQQQQPPRPAPAPAMAAPPPSPAPPSAQRPPPTAAPVQAPKAAPEGGNKELTRSRGNDNEDDKKDKK